MNQFSISVGACIHNDYLKIELFDEQKINDVREFVETLPFVEKANVFEKRSHGRNITVYPKSICTLDELQIELENALNAYFQEDNEFKSNCALGLDKFLVKYPLAHKHYICAKEKYERGIYIRNTLDDMRFSLEQLLKSILKNNMSIERQKEALGRYLKEKGASPEVRNLFQTVLDYYMCYQNNNVKHNEDLSPNDVRTIVNQTLLLMDRLKNEEGGNK